MVLRVQKWSVVAPAITMATTEGPQQPPWGLTWGKERPLALTDATTFFPKSIGQQFKPGNGQDLTQSIILYARRNPSLQKLVDNYEAWERNYR